MEENGILPFESPRDWDWFHYKEPFVEKETVAQRDMVMVNRAYEELSFAHEKLCKGEYVEDERGEEKWVCTANMDGVSAAIETALNAVEGLTKPPRKWSGDTRDIFESSRRHAKWIEEHAIEYAKDWIAKAQREWEREKEHREEQFKLEMEEFVEAEVQRRIDRMYGRKAVLKRRKLHPGSFRIVHDKRSKSKG